jgi:hypothetical protein
MTFATFKTTFVITTTINIGRFAYYWIADGDSGDAICF